MRARPVDHSLWLAIGHASHLNPDGFSAPSGEAVQTCQELIHRALEAGADPNAEFTLPSEQGERVRLTCMERAFGQLHATFLIPLMQQAIERGWRADVLPSGLWATGQRASGTSAYPPQPEAWRLSAVVVSMEPGWLQLVASGNPWGKAETSAALCRLLLSANAPLLRPAQACLDAENEEEGALAYREMNDPLRLAVGRGGNLDVAIELVQAGALDHWKTPESIGHLINEVKFGSGGEGKTAKALISMIQAQFQARELEGHTANRPSPASPRRSL